MKLAVLVLGLALVGRVGAEGLLGMEETGEPQGGYVNVWWQLPEPVRMHLQGPLDRMESEGYATRAAEPWPSRVKEWQAIRPRISWAEYVVDRAFGPAGTNRMLLVFAKLLHEGLWGQVRVLAPLYGGYSYVFLMPYDMGEFRRALGAKGYSTSYNANRDGNSTLGAMPLPEPYWGVRSPKVGAELHVRFNPVPGTGPMASAHLDVENPGTYQAQTWGETLDPTRIVRRGAKHFVDEYLADQLGGRDPDQVAATLLRKLREQGVWVPQVEVTRP